MCLTPNQFFSFPFTEKKICSLLEKHFLGFVILEGWWLLPIKLIAYRDWRHALKLLRNHQSVSCKMHQYCISAYNEFLQECNRKYLPISKQIYKN